jgi:hypothetical protein
MAAIFMRVLLGNAEFGPVGGSLLKTVSGRQVLEVMAFSPLKGAGFSPYIAGRQNTMGFGPSGMFFRLKTEFSAELPDLPL